MKTKTAVHKMFTRIVASCCCVHMNSTELLARCASSAPVHSSLCAFARVQRSIPFFSLCGMPWSGPSGGQSWAVRCGTEVSETNWLRLVNNWVIGLLLVFLTFPISEGKTSVFCLLLSLIYGPFLFSGCTVPFIAFSFWANLVHESGALWKSGYGRIRKALASHALQCLGPSVPTVEKLKRHKANSNSELKRIHTKAIQSHRTCHGCRTCSC